MTVIDLLRLDAKKGLRSKAFYKNLVINLILGLFALYMAAAFLILGFTLGEILESVPGTLNPTEILCEAGLYIILFSLLIRMMMQSLNTLDLQTFQTLPIKRNTLVNYLLIKPLFNPTNYVTLLLILPFASNSTAAYYDGGTALRFVIACIFIIWFDSLAAALLKRKFGGNLLALLLIIGLIVGLGVLDYFKIFSLSKISGVIFQTTLLHPAGLLIPLTAVAIAYGLNRWFFARYYYAESFDKKKNQAATASNLSFLDRFGTIGDLAGLEIKLILRHKRTKSILYLSIFFLFYGLIFYTNPTYKGNYGMLFFCATFVTGLLMLMFGQWVISWDSSNFNGLMTQNIPIASYIEANYYLLASFCIACFILTTPYFFFGFHILWLHLAALLFNLGVNIFLLVFFATYNTKRLDLSKGSAMNYQGVSIKNFLVMIPMLFVPWVLVWLLSSLSSLNIALLVVGGIGVIGIIFHRQLIQLCVEQFNRRKYALAEGFRESE